MRHIPPGPELELDDSTELPRRRSPRFADPGLSGRLTRSTETEVIDLSVAGIGLESFEPIAPREKVTVRLEDFGPPIHLEAHSCWNRLTRLNPSRKGDSQAVYRLGLRFDDPENAVDEKLEALLRERGDDVDPTRKPPRFRMPVGSRARVQTQSGFEVRTLSLSGMLVETRRLETPGDQVDLHLDLPDGDLPIRARVVDSWRETLGPKVSLAVAFDRIPSEARERLDSFIEGRLAETATP